MRFNYNDYSAIIFDCDGVIFNSNNLKILAMEETLISLGVSELETEKCIHYFANNFGKSRFHHVNVFIERFIDGLCSTELNSLKDEILQNYSSKCFDLYMKSELTPGFIDFMDEIVVKCFIASGSEEIELRNVIEARGLMSYFCEVYGSPKSKNDIVSDILETVGNNNCLMIGDAISDLNAALVNEIDFVAYTPYSNVKAELIDKTIQHNFKVVSSWNEFNEV
ncbi:HAD family hydrolase [Devosia sp.]|uniref:HAD family hydrolase n=1 Tax=Devosia sp. TaxID=1871048 RepID=UPI003A8CE127